MAKAAARLAPYLLISLPAVLSFIFVSLFGVNVVFRDQWEIAGLFGKLHSGELSISELWAPHNEHRFFFPRIAMLALGAITGWNNLAEMYLIQLCLVTTLVVLFLAFRGSLGIRPWLFIPVAFLILSLRQWFNMLWGYQLTFAFTQTFGVLALYFLYRASAKHPGIFLSLAILCATVAAGSSIQGLLVWPAGLLLVLLLSMKRWNKAAFTGLWVSVGLAEWVVYFVGYDRGVGSSLPRLLASPVAGAEYFLTLVGNSLTSQQGLVAACGAALVIITVLGALVALRQRERGAYPFWISLSAFSLLIALSITAGRGDLGVESALAPRYTTFSLLAVVGAYAIFAKLWTDVGGEPVRSAFATLTTAVLVGVAISYSNGFQLGAAEEASRKQAAAVLEEYETRPDADLRIIHRRPEVVESRAPRLERLGYNVFSEG